MSGLEEKQGKYIKDAVDLIFKKYDCDKNGVLEGK